MNVKPAEIRHLGTYERKNEDGQQGHNQRSGIPILTFLNSYNSFLLSYSSRLMQFGDFIRRHTRSYAASVVQPLWRTRHPLKCTLKRRFDVVIDRVSHIPPHTALKEAPQ